MIFKVIGQRSRSPCHIFRGGDSPRFALPLFLFLLAWFRFPLYRHQYKFMNWDIPTIVQDMLVIPEHLFERLVLWEFVLSNNLLCCFALSSCLSNLSTRYFLFWNIHWLICVQLGIVQMWRVRREWETTNYIVFFKSTVIYYMYIACNVNHDN